MRHDGTEVAVGSEKYLCHFSSAEEEAELKSLGIRRFRLQNLMAAAVEKAGIPIVMGEVVQNVTLGEDTNSPTTITFASGRVITATLVFACDGANSVTRTSLFGAVSAPIYTGITILMGSADMPRPQPGICFPSSEPSRCHAVYYPTGTQCIMCSTLNLSHTVTMCTRSF